MKIKIVTTKLDRDEFVDTFEFYLQQAERVVNGMEIEHVLIDQRECPKLKDENIIHKSKLLNYAIKKINGDFDILAFLDIDLIVQNDFFKTLKIYCTEKNIVFLGGLKLTNEPTFNITKDFPDVKKVFDKSNIYYGQIEPLTEKENSQHAYIGNWAISKRMYEKILEIVSLPLYNESIKGFGGEDNIISFLASDMQNCGLCKKVYLPNIWRHMYHERYTDHPFYNANVAIMHKQICDNRNKLQIYIGKKENES